MKKKTWIIIAAIVAVLAIVAVVCTVVLKPGYKIDVSETFAPACPRDAATSLSLGSMSMGTSKNDILSVDSWIVADAKGKSHVHEFFDAIREGRKANADFVEYAVPLVKTVLLGNVVALAARDGKPRVEWDGTRVTNNPAANAYCRTTYRKGWEIES